MAVAEKDRVTIGRIERPFGVKGGVKVRSLSDVPGRFDGLASVTVLGATGHVSDRTVTQVRRAGSTYILHFDGITTPEEAGTLRGGLIQVPRGERLAPQADTYYECDLIGLAVQDETGRELGQVEAIWDLPGHQMFVIKQAQRELLIPAAKEFVKAVDLKRRRMTVHVIEGLVELRDAV